MRSIRQRETGESTTAQIRTVLFWVAMILVAVLLWEMATGSSSSKTLPSLNASEFESQLQSKDIREVQVTVYQARALFSGEDQRSGAKFEAYVVVDQAPRVISDLQESGKIVRMRGAVEEDWLSLVLDALPFAILLITFVFVLRRQQARNRNIASVERQQ